MNRLAVVAQNDRVQSARIVSHWRAKITTGAAAAAKALVRGVASA
jgi:hypothetical protein